MADVYTPPPDSSYLLVTPFSMPSNIGDRWAVSFTGNNSTLVAAALSIVVTVSFLCLWNFISFIAVLAVPKPTRHKYVAAVVIWNSNDPWFAFKELLLYTYRQAQRNTEKKQWKHTWYGLVFCLLALAVFGTSIAMGIIAPSLVQIGNVAPVRPSAVFYPTTPTSDADLLRDFGLRAPSVMRSLGSVEAAAVTLRQKVAVKANEDFDTPASSERNVGVDYGYSLSGVDLGISGGSNLGLVVKGHCMTEYGWSRDPPEDEDSTNAYDEYRLWNDPSPDAAQFVYLNDFDTQMAQISWQRAISCSSPPAATPELRETPDDATRFNAAFRMKRWRPVLSCREKNSWTYAGQTVASVVDLKAIPGIKIPRVLLEILETTLSGGPMVVRLGNASGDSALRSRSTSPNGVIDAGSSSMFTDMERLILASYAATRNIFTDAVMFGQPDNYGNVAEGPDGQPREGAGNYVIQSPDIQTFSLTGIVVLLVILATLILLNCVTSLLIHFNHQPSVANNAKGDNTNNSVTENTNPAAENIAISEDKTGNPPDITETGTSSASPENKNRTHNNKWTRFHVLAATQLFRCVYEQDPEQGTKREPREEWSCDSSAMTHYGTDEESFVIETCDKPKCMGHIRKEIEGSDKTGQGSGHEDSAVGRGGGES
ncbi:hypothetical protein F5144DRAFT_634473 [Chaetomium tenue]|uniref:Uncharacterized protein n=1 Tax=Chaetomium tenue TaxID=1854479 RepID=A0ACB7PQI4_9PEZI|nr:hypothetical protein F5144DRAFT_634473 [Chaetomium globosum]